MTVIVAGVLCPECHGLTAATTAQRVYGGLMIDCPTCGPQPYRATFHNPPPLIIDKGAKQRTRRERDKRTHQRRAACL
jgi:hypothetical protein